MTKRADTPPPDETPILEMDAMDEAEWEQDQHTPIVEDDKLAALVKESGPRDAGPSVGRVSTQSIAGTNVVKRAPTSAGSIHSDASRMRTPPPTPTKLPPPTPARSQAATKPAPNQPIDSAAAKPRADATGTGAKNTIARTATKTDLASAAAAATSDGRVASGASAKADASAKSKSPTAFLMNASSAPKEMASDLPSSPIASVLGAVSAKPGEATAGGRRRRETSEALAAVRTARAPAPTPDSALPIAREPSETPLRSTLAVEKAPPPTKQTRTMAAVEKTPPPTKTTSAMPAVEKTPPPTKTTSAMPAVEKTPPPTKTSSTMAAVEKTPSPTKTSSTMAAVEKTPSPTKTSSTMAAVEKTPSPTKTSSTMAAVEKTPSPTKTSSTMAAVEKTPSPTKISSTMAAVEKTPPPTKSELPLPAPGITATRASGSLATAVPTDDATASARGASSTSSFVESGTAVDPLPPPPSTVADPSDWDSAATSTMVSPHQPALAAANAAAGSLGLPAWPPPQASPPATATTGPSHPPIAATPVGATPAGAFGAAPAPSYPSAAPYLSADAPVQAPVEARTGRADASWSRSPGTAADDDAPLVPGRSPREALLAFAKSPKKLAIAGGALVFVIFVFVVALGGGKKTATKSGSQTVASAPAKSKSKSKLAAAHPATSAPTEEATAAETTDEPTEPSTDSPTQPSRAIATSTGTAATTPSETPSASADPGAGSATPETTTPAAATTATPAAATTATPTTTIEAKPAIARPVAKKIGGKRVVLEYDNQARDTKPAPAAAPSDQTAVAKARSAYNSGNQRLFTGDTNGAIRYYKQSLAQYPGYVAGYRGLGLAYMQAGDKANALQALRTYISSVPNAKDAPLVRKRIATLQVR